MAQLDAKKTAWNPLLRRNFKSFEEFKKYYDPMYKNMKAEDVWKKIGGEIPKKKKKADS